MKKLNQWVKLALLTPLLSVGLFASDRFGYTISVPEKRTTIIITCKDTDKRILQAPGFQGLVEPIGGILAGSLQHLSENRTYLVYVRPSRGKLYCHVDEEPVGQHPVVRDFPFTRKQWNGLFIEKVLGGILGIRALPRKSVVVREGSETALEIIAKVEFGPVPGQPLHVWSVSQK